VHSRVYSDPKTDSEIFSLVEIAGKIQSVFFFVFFFCFVGKELDTTKAVISHCCNLRTATADALKFLLLLLPHSLSYSCRRRRYLLIWRPSPHLTTRQCCLILLPTPRPLPSARLAADNEKSSCCFSSSSSFWKMRVAADDDFVLQMPPSARLAAIFIKSVCCCCCCCCCCRCC
jgi:hypothetical protein